MIRKPIFWLGFAAMTGLSIWFSAHYFSEAFPIVQLDLKMDRETALQSARKLAAANNWGPAEFRQAASFDLDREVQTYVELEAGGTTTFAEMLAGDLYAPYTWQVRHFKQGETNETRIRFTPTGTFYGFRQKLPEAAPGASLPTDSARTIAESAAVALAGIDLAAFELIEASQENRPGGRTDHTFVYERPNEQVNEARYRLRLVVSGDRLTELTHFMKIPEAFSRKYEEMRSANDTIAFGSAVAMAVLYILGGCVIGLFFLLRQRWVIWRTPVLWGAFIGFLQFLAGINQLPLAWMGYDTALSSGSFLAQQIAASLANALLMGALMALSFMAAESLSRKAFPHHLQFWRLWTKDVAATPSVLGQTIAGYMLVGLFFAYEVMLYFFSTKTLGWWTPSEALFHPDALATYFPWLTSIAISAQAGFWEESLFRAVPIAGAALLGQRYGKRTLWLIGAFIIQALVFGAGHANYPTQPAYARLVELIIPSIGFGLLYYLFGLLPAIILHFTVDVTWFALPLFLATAPGAWVNQVMVVVLAAVPLLVVLVNRLRAGKWVESSPELQNQAWTPPPPKKAESEPETPSEAARMPAWVPKLLWIGGAVGLGLWILLTAFENQAPQITVNRQAALQCANEALAARQVFVKTPWKVMSAVAAPNDEDDRFIWQTAGPDIYRQLMGTHLAPPFWRVRIAKFTGDVAERAEEWEVHVDGGGQTRRVRHKLPEKREGASLSEEQARALADSALHATYGFNPARLKFVASEPKKREARMDWQFTFADTAAYQLPQGEARLVVSIAGDEVIDVYRTIHVPEDWQRQDRSRRALPQILTIGSTVILILVILAGAVLGIVMWSRKRFSAKTFLAVLLGLVVLNLISNFNNWPAVEIQFSTAQPYKNQAATFVLAFLLGALFMSAAVAMVAGVVHRWMQETPALTGRLSPIAATGLGALAAGLLAALAQLEPNLAPRWANYSNASAFLPVFNTALQPVAGLIIRSTTLFLVFVWIDRYTHNWQRQRGLAVAAVLFFGIAATGSAGVETIVTWLLEGFAFGLLLLLVYRFVLRYDLAIIPMALAVYSLLAQIRQASFHAFPGAMAGEIIAIGLLLVVGLFWSRKVASVRK